MNTGMIVLVGLVAYMVWKQQGGGGGGLFPAVMPGPSDPLGTTTGTTTTTGTATAAEDTTAMQERSVPIYTPEIIAGVWTNAPPGAHEASVWQNRLITDGRQRPDTFPPPAGDLTQEIHRKGSIDNVLRQAFENFFSVGSWGGVWKLPIKHWNFYRGQISSSRYPTQADGVNLDQQLTYVEYLDLLRSKGMLQEDQYGNLSGIDRQGEVNWA